MYLQSLQEEVHKLHLALNEERKVTEKLSRNLELEKRRSESLEQKAKNAFRKSGLSDIGCEVSSSIDFFVCYRNHSSGLETGVYRISANSFRP